MLPLIAVLVGIVVVAVAKPWDPAAAPGSRPADTGPPLPIGLRPEASAVTSPGPGPVAPAGTAGATTWPGDPNATPCMSANGERLVTLIRTPDQDVRSWQLVDGGEGRDAFQPGLVPIRILSSHVVGIGMCAAQPDQGSEVQPAGEALDVILLSEPGAGNGIVDLGRPASITLPGGEEDAVLYAAPSALRIGPDGSFVPPWPSQGLRVGPGAMGSLATWAVGSYAMAFRYPADAPAVVRWVRFDVVAAPGIFG